MANIYLYLDKRAPRKDGTCSLKVALAHKRETAYCPLEIYIRPEEWDRDRQQVVSRADKKFHNVIIKKRLAEMTLAMQRIMLRDDAGDLSARDIMRMLARGTDTPEGPEEKDYLLPVYNEYIALCNKTSTALSYRTSLNSLVEFDKDIDSVRFKDINVAWLRRYIQWMKEERGMSVNGANVYLRNLRRVFNYALKNDYTRARYPFRDIDMSTTEPDKYDIKWQKFLEWASKPMADNRKFYRDLFMLSFFLCGIRPVDLLTVKKDQVVDGRLVYWPEKLNGKTKLSIKIEPEAWAIIRRWEGKEHLIRVMDERTDYKAFCQHWNRALKAIGDDEHHREYCKNGRYYNIVKHVGILPKISIYCARGCWASYAYNIVDIPMDIISQALGHKSGLRVTNFYVRRDSEKVDQANRKLIDRFRKDLAEYRAKHQAS